MRSKNSKVRHFVFFQQKFLIVVQMIAKTIQIINLFYILISGQPFPKYFSESWKAGHFEGHHFVNKYNKKQRKKTFFISSASILYTVKNLEGTRYFYYEIKVFEK